MTPSEIVRHVQLDALTESSAQKARCLEDISRVGPVSSHGLPICVNRRGGLRSVCLEGDAHFRHFHIAKRVVYPQPQDPILVVSTTYYMGRTPTMRTSICFKPQGGGVTSFGVAECEAGRLLRQFYLQLDASNLLSWDDPRIIIGQAIEGRWIENAYNMSSEDTYHALQETVRERLAIFKTVDDWGVFSPDLKEFSPLSEGVTPLKVIQRARLAAKDLPMPDPTRVPDFNSPMRDRLDEVIHYARRREPRTPAEKANEDFQTRGVAEVGCAAAIVGVGILDGFVGTKGKGWARITPIIGNVFQDQLCTQMRRQAEEIIKQADELDKALWLRKQLEAEVRYQVELERERLKKEIEFKEEYFKATCDEFDKWLAPRTYENNDYTLQSKYFVFDDNEPRCEDDTSDSYYGRGGGHGSCFVGGTPIATSCGSVSIETLRPGDNVIGFDVEQGSHCEQRVAEVFRTNDMRLIALRFGAERLLTTEEHPFFSGKWKLAGALKKGDQIMRLDGSWEVLSQDPCFCGHGPVFNIHVRPSQTFFVGENKLLVHNKYTLSVNDICSEDWPWPA